MNQKEMIEISKRYLIEVLRLIRTKDETQIKTILLPNLKNFLNILIEIETFVDTSKLYADKNQEPLSFQRAKQILLALKQEEEQRSFNEVKDFIRDQITPLTSIYENLEKGNY